MSHPRHQPRGADPEDELGRLRVRLPTDGSVDLAALRASLQAHLDQSATGVAAPEPIPEPVVQPEPVVAEPIVLPEPKRDRGLKFAGIILFVGIALMAVVMIVGVFFLNRGNGTLGWPIAGLGFLLMCLGIFIAWRQRTPAIDDEIDQPIEIEEVLPGPIEIEEEKEPNVLWIWIKENPVFLAIAVLAPLVVTIAIYAAYNFFSPSDPNQPDEAKENPPPAKPATPAIAAATEPIPAELRTLAGAGDIDAQFELGARQVARHQLSAIDKDQKSDTWMEAKIMFERTATNGHPVGRYNAGVLHLNASISAVDHTRWLASAEEQFAAAVQQQPALQHEIAGTYDTLAKQLIAQTKQAASGSNTGEDPVPTEPVEVVTEPETTHHAEEGWGGRLIGTIVLLLGAGFGLFYGSKKSESDFNHKFHFIAGLRQLVASQGPHLLVAGIVGMVVVWFLLPNLAADHVHQLETNWHEGLPTGTHGSHEQKPDFAEGIGLFDISRILTLVSAAVWAVAVGVPLAALIVLVFGVLGVDLMPTLDHNNATGKKPVWRFLNRKIWLISVLAMFIGFGIALVRSMPVMGLILPWLQYSLGIGLAAACLSPRGLLASHHENLPVLKEAEFKVSILPTIRDNFSTILLISLPLSCLWLQEFGWDWQYLLFFLGGVMLMVSVIFYNFLMKPQHIRQWLSIVTTASVLSLIVSFIAGPWGFWIAMVGTMILLGQRVFQKSEFNLFTGGRLLVMPEVDRPARPLIQFSNDGQSAIHWGGLAGLAMSMLMLLGVAGFFVWGETQTITSEPTQFAEKPNSKAGPPKQPGTGTAVNPDLIREFQAMARKWRNRPSVAEVIPPVFDKLTAGFLIPKKSAFLSNDNREISAQRTLTAQVERFTSNPSTNQPALRIDLHPSGRWLVETKRNSLLVWDLGPRKATGRFALTQRVRLRFNASPRDLMETRSRFSLDGGVFRVSLTNNQFELLQFTSGKLLRGKNINKPENVFWIGPAHRYLAQKLITKGFQVQIEDLQGAEPQRTIKSLGQPKAMNNFVFSPDNIHVAFSASAGTVDLIELWSWRENRFVFVFPSTKPINSLKFSHDGSRLYSIDDAHHLTGWKTTGERELLFRVPLNAKSSVQLSADPSGKRVLASWIHEDERTNAQVRHWQVVDAVTGAVIFARFQNSTPLSFSQNGRWLAAGENRTVQIWDLTTGALATNAPRLPIRASQVHFARNDTVLVLITPQGGTHIVPFE